MSGTQKMIGTLREEKPFLIGTVIRFVVGISLTLLLSGPAFAQYGGGGMGTGASGSGTSGYGAPSYGSGKAIGIGVGAAAAAVVGIALYVHHRHNAANAARSQASHVIGCTQSEINGISLKNENNEQIYMIISSGTPLQVGQRVELTGVVTDQGPGARTFRVQGPIRSYGSCSATAAALTQTATAQAH
jgi:hypothetical protein